MLINMASQKKILFITFLIASLLGFVLFFFLKKNQETSDQTTPDSSVSIPSLPAGSDEASTVPSAINSNLSDQYKLENIGSYGYEYLRNNPDFVSKIQKIKGDFKINDIAVSAPILKAALAGEKRYLMFWGCTEYDCNGTINVIAYGENSDNIFLLVENSPGKYDFFGNPPEEEKGLLEYIYLAR